MSVRGAQPITRREEKRLCAEIARTAARVAESGLDHAELYFARVHLQNALTAFFDRFDESASKVSDAVGQA